MKHKKYTHVKSNNNYVEHLREYNETNTQYRIWVSSQFKNRHSVRAYQLNHWLGWLDIDEDNTPKPEHEKEISGEEAFMMML